MGILGILAVLLAQTADVIVRDLILYSIKILLSTAIRHGLQERPKKLKLMFECQNIYFQGALA